MGSQYRCRQLLDRKLLFQILLGKQAQTRGDATLADSLAPVAQRSEAVDQRLLEMLQDVCAGTTHLAQGHQAQGFLAGLAAVEKVIVQIGQRTVQRRAAAIQYVFLQRVQQRPVGRRR